MASNCNNINNNNKVPPGFRFHPTDEELVDYYLKKKVESQRIDLDVIREIDLYKIEPWDLQERCRIGSTDQDEWYFFSHKDKKYPTGTRTNRATTAGFWKATGRDKAIYSRHKLVGMRKTLVFYRGRAPNGQKTDWIMHEYRLENCESNCNPLQTSEEGWAVCRVFKKRSPNVKMLFPEHNMPSMGSTSNIGGCSFEDQMSTFLNSNNTHHYMMGMERGILMDDGLVYGHSWNNNNVNPIIDNGHRERHRIHNGKDDDEDEDDDDHGLHQVSFACKQELDQLTDYHISHDTSFMQLPQLLESPPLKLGTSSRFPVSSTQHNHNHICHNHIHQEQYGEHQNHSSTLSHLRALIGSPNITQTLNLSNGTTHDFPTHLKVPISNNVVSAHMQQVSLEVTDWRILDRLVASQLSQDSDLARDSPIQTVTSMPKASTPTLDLHNPTNDNEDDDTNINTITNTTITASTDNKIHNNDPIPNLTPNYNSSNDVDLWSFTKRSELEEQL